MAVLGGAGSSRSGDAWFLPWVQFDMGLVEYRMGHPEAVLRWVDRSLAHPGSSAYPPLRMHDHFLRALALARLGRLDEARADLASGLAAGPPPRLDGRPFDAGWHDDAISHLLLREAELACLDASFPRDPFRRPGPP